MFVLPHLEAGSEIRAEQSNDAVTVTMESNSAGSASLSYVGDSLTNLTIDGHNAFEVVLSAAPSTGTLFAYAEDGQTVDYASLPINITEKEHRKIYKELSDEQRGLFTVKTMSVEKRLQLEGYKVALSMVLMRDERASKTELEALRRRWQCCRRSRGKPPADDECPHLARPHTSAWPRRRCSRFPTR